MMEIFNQSEEFQEEPVRLQEHLQVVSTMIPDTRLGLLMRQLRMKACKMSMGALVKDARSDIEFLVEHLELLLTNEEYEIPREERNKVVGLLARLDQTIQSITPYE